MRKGGFIIYFSPTGSIIWAYSATSIKAAYDDSFFEQCKVTEDSLNNAYIVSLLYVATTKMLVLVK